MTDYNLPMPTCDPLTIYTIGHSNHPIEKILGLLQAHGIQTLADVRSKPYSRYNPQFKQSALKESVEETGISYLFLGEEFGGRPSDPTLIDANGHAIYERVVETPKFRVGMLKLSEAAKESRVAIMCAEENPDNCHRHNLLTPYLLKHHYAVLHIRGNGSLETAEAPRKKAQMRLL